MHFEKMKVYKIAIILIQDNFLIKKKKSSKNFISRQ